MQSDWKLSSLRDCVIHKKGFAFKSKHYEPSGTPVVKVTNLTNDGIDMSSVVFVNTDIAIANASVALISGDIIITTVGSWAANPASVVGKTIKVPLEAEGALLNQNAVRLRPKDKSINKQFLYYLLKNGSFSKYLVSNAQGSANQASITLNDIYTYETYIPPLQTQKKIAHILSTLDDKIELNRKMNKTLEEMAQVLFKSWFVNFDPVHAKADCTSDEELEQAATVLSMSKEVLELFPSEFEESEIGMIPKGWEVKPFGELLSKTIGGDWGKEEPDDKHTERVKIIRGTDIPKIKSNSIETVPTRYVETKKLKTRELFDGDIVIEVSGGTKNQPTGRTLYIINDIINMLGGKVEPASFCRLFRPVNAEVGLLLGQHMLYIYEQGKTWQYQNQSTGISNFQTTIFLEKEYVIVPDDKVLTKFYDIVRPIVEMSLSSENITLQKTRDILLPKLLSGELDVSNLEVN